MKGVKEKVGVFFACIKPLMVLKLSLECFVIQESLICFPPTGNILQCVPCFPLLSAAMLGCPQTGAVMQFSALGNSVQLCCRKESREGFAEGSFQST